MTDLLARLEVVEAGSRELDFAIMDLLGYEDVSDPRDVVECWRGRDGKSHFANATFTRSIDAALALAERLGLDVLAIMNEAVEGLAVGGWSSSLQTLVPELARHACIAILRATHKAEGAEG